MLVLATVISIVSFLFGFSKLTITLAVISAIGGVMISVGAYQAQKVLERKQIGK